MPDFSWYRSWQNGDEDTTTADYIAVELVTFETSPVTFTRVIVDWDLQLLQSSTDSPLPWSAPSGVGLAITTAPAGTAPPAPSAGPLSNPGGPWLWWEGAPWRPIAPFSPTANYSGCDGRIDRNVNKEINTADYTSLWLVSEVVDASSNFIHQYLTTYFQVLYHPTG